MSDGNTGVTLERHGECNRDVCVALYGYFSEPLGRGTAARAYAHCLHSVGVKVIPVNLSSRSLVRDDLVESLRMTEVATDPEFHLFCGPPPGILARRLCLRRTICLCAWETDTMPMEWKETLEQVREVWVPSEHNASVFRRELRVPVFCCPHALNPQLAVAGIADGSVLPQLSTNELVFYSIFAWQERKHPFGIVEAYLKAFRDRSDVCLILKTRLRKDAQRAVQTRIQQLRRTLGSPARVEVVGEFWTEDQIRALLERGDCYVSLHRGEGWCYPLFDAACRGIPVIATAYSGPLDYLDADHHDLIRYTLTPVQQQYVYYKSQMLWADPDLEQATSCMRNVDGNRRGAKCRAQAAVQRLQTEFSFDSVGRLAKQRLLRLLTDSHDADWRVAGVTLRGRDLQA